jgi:hypothetical protein
MGDPQYTRPTHARSSLQKAARILLAFALAGCAEGESDFSAGSDEDDPPGAPSASAASGGGGKGGAQGGTGGAGGSGGSAEHSYIYASSDIYLYRIDTATLGPGVVVENVGTFGIVPDRMTDIAVSPSGVMYGITWHDGASPNKLWTIDANTAAPTYVADIQGSADVALTFTADGSLLGADKGGRMFRVDTTTGLSTDIGEWGGLGASGDLVGSTDGALYGFADAGGSASEAVNTLVMVDEATGVASEIGSTGFANLWGAAFYCGTLYGFGADGDLLEIDVKTGQGTLLAGKIPSAKSGFSGAGASLSSPTGTVGGGCD